MFITENDIKRWEGRHPEILKEVISGVFDNEPRKLLTKKQVQSADGKIHDICTFYDFEKKCLIHEVKPEICKKFSCTAHLFFFFNFSIKFSAWILFELVLAIRIEYRQREILDYLIIQLGYTHSPTGGAPLKGGLLEAPQ